MRFAPRHAHEHGQRSGVITLRADRLRELAADVAGLRGAADHGREIVLRAPAEIRARARAVVHAVERGQHPPAEPLVDRLPPRHAARLSRPRELGDRGEQLMQVDRLHAVAHEPGDLAVVTNVFVRISRMYAD